MRIETGTPEEHPNVLPINTSATPGVVAATPMFPSGSEQGGVLTDTSGVDFTADAATAMAAGMAADAARRDRLAADILPQGTAYGDQLVLPPSPLDPGVGSTGEALPTGHYYDPPRSYGDEPVT